ncbi:hypothetical protein KFE94_03455 [bacterium SCSIO 12643]|nr:hypothetical protein KFE94_03455 [bacterium SCSIO 12643]
MKRLILLVLYSITTSLSAQNVLSIYNMRHIPQVVYANPSFIPLGRVNVSIPGLGSTYAQVGKSAFVTQGVANVDANGTLRLDVDKFLNGLEDENLVYGGTSIEALHVGFSAGKNYIFFASNDKISADFEFPKSLAILISEVYEDLGIPNGYHRIDDTKVQYTHVREYSVGWARRINKDLNVGVRFKLLSGIANIRTNSTGIVIDSATADNELSGLININMQTSGITELTDDPLRAVAGYSNYGYALDFGFDYRINQKFKIAASVLDLMGTVKWKDNINNYEAENVRVDFNTVDWASIINPGSGNGFGAIYDSIVENVDPNAVKTPYETHTPTKVIASGTYFITPKIEATVVGEGLFAPDFFQPYVRVGIQGRVKRFLNYMISYSIVDDREDFKNLGVGFAINLGPFQLHALTDNIFDPYITSYKNFNPSVRAGINLTIGRDYE